MLKLDMSHKTLRSIQTLNPKQYRQVVGTIFQLLRNPEPQDSSPLCGNQYRRVDIGEYRIIYGIEADTPQILLAGKRNDNEVYRDAQRLR